MRGKRNEAQAVRFLLAVGLVCLLCGADWTDRDKVWEFNVPRQKVDAALTTVAQQTGTQLLFPYDEVRSQEANPLTGRYTLNEALEIMLRSTGLSGDVTASGVITVSAVPEAEGHEQGEQMKADKKKGLGALLASIFTVGAASAQEPVDSGAQAGAMEEIVVTGVRGSLARALDQKRNAAGVVDSIAAEDLADFPDLNISESLQRITGVSIVRMLGEGQQVSVRGLAPQFTRVTMNGQTVTSGASGTPGIATAGREVDFDIFASELFTNVQLTKTPSASLTEGGLAATIDLRTARPFDFAERGPVIAVSAQGTYNDLRGETSPRLSLVASNNNLAEGKLGLLGSVSYSESALRQDSVEGFRFLLTDYDMDGDGSPEFSDVEIPFIPRYVLEEFDRERLGVTAAMQVRPSDRIDIALDVAYAEFDEVRTRYSIDGLLQRSYPPIGAIEVDSTGLVTRATLNGNNGEGVSSRSENLHSPTQNDLLLINLESRWHLTDDWEARLKLGYSEASSSEQESRAVYQALNTFTYDFSDRIFVRLEPGENVLAPGTTVDFTDPSHFSHNQTRVIDTNVDDRDTSFQADISRVLDNPWLMSISGGVRFNERKKGQVQFDGRLTSAPGDMAPTAAIAANLPVDDFFSQHSSNAIQRNWFVTDFAAFFADPTVNRSSFDTPQQFINSFTITEKTAAAYLQADFDSGRIRGNVGVRVINTDQASEGFLADGTPISQDQSYTEALPSLNLVAELRDDVLMRFAASRTLTRPTLFSLSPGGTVAPTGLTANLGNPDLDPFLATQYDASFEWYFAEEALAAATFFYKDVDSFIVNVTSESTINAGTQINDAGEDVSNAIYTVTRPVNGEGASVDGFELSLQTPFRFLPEPLDGFGALANYTYAHSKSTIQFNGETITTLLPGQSESSYNLIGYYEKGRFSGRLAYSWRDKFLSEVRASDAERSNFTDEYGQLDASFQYAATDNLTVVLDALNITEEEILLYSERPDRNRAFGETGRFITFGIRGKF